MMFSATPDSERSAGRPPVRLMLFCGQGGTSIVFRRGASRKTGGTRPAMSYIIFG